MAARLFSKDPLSWGQTFFLWVGGALVVTGLVTTAFTMEEQRDDALRRADRWEYRAERLFEGLPEFETPTRPTLGDFPRIPLRTLIRPELDPPGARSNRSDVEEPSAEPGPDPVEREMERLRSVFEVELRRVRDSMAVNRMEEAQVERSGAGLWFGGEIALLLVAAGVVGFLVWRSFHGAARA